MGLPDKDNRERILRTILEKEAVADDLDFAELANTTEGFSGSDLKVPIFFVCLLMFCFVWVCARVSVPMCVREGSFLDIKVSCVLQNLCTVAAYRPIRELMKEEQKVRDHLARSKILCYWSCKYA